MTTVFESTSWSELRGNLEATDVSVPGRTEGRRSCHREHYDICHLLSSLGEINKLVFPLRLLKRESPDFLLLQGLHEIGIEHAVSCQEAYEKALTRQARNGGALRLRAVGLQPETQWANLIAQTVAKKSTKFNAPHFLTL